MPDSGDEERASVELVLDHLKRARAFDFTGYKRATLARRIDKRMEQLGITGYAEYVDRLEVDPDEFEPLFNTILINVTSLLPRRRDLGRHPRAVDARPDRSTAADAPSGSGASVAPAARRPTPSPCSWPRRSASPG